jgi:SAM-dependent methyltransferase
MGTQSDKVFAGTIPRLYEAHLVPLIFAVYADDLAQRVASRTPLRVLELAAGTGVATRALAKALPAAASIVATDLNEAMLNEARSIGTARPVTWLAADAMHLPFDDASFDAVACQFGAMFFPDKAAAFREVRRVLVPGGRFAFSVWDRIEDNEFADVVTRSLATRFPEDPPRFLARTPHGYHDRAAIARDLADGGFAAPPAIDTVTERSRAASPDIPAFAYCAGTPLANELEARAPGKLDEAIERTTNAIAERFGRGVVDGRIQAHVIVAEA